MGFQIFQVIETASTGKDGLDLLLPSTSLSGWFFPFGACQGLEPLDDLLSSVVEAFDVTLRAA